MMNLYISPLHTAVIAFVGAFVLVTYKLKEEKKEEHKTADKAEKGSNSNSKANTDDGLYSTNPRLEQSASMGWGRWGSSSGGPPTDLLKSAHGIAIGAAFFGFI